MKSRNTVPAFTIYRDLVYALGPALEVGDLVLRHGFLLLPIGQCYYMTVRGAQGAARSVGVQQPAPVRVTPLELIEAIPIFAALTMDEKPMRVRIDRMKEVRKLGASARRRETFISYNDRHQPIQSIVGIKIQLRCKIEKADALLERFGTGVEIYNVQADTFMANLRIVPNDQFYAWAFLNSADVQVVSPAQVADHLCELSAQVLKQYDSQKE